MFGGLTQYFDVWVGWNLNFICGEFKPSCWLKAGRLMKDKTGSKFELMVGCDIVVVGDLETGCRLRRMGCINADAVDCGVEFESSSGDCE